MNILFVCSGNTCRSPLAEALVRHDDPHGCDLESYRQCAQAIETACDRLLGRLQTNQNYLQNMNESS